VGIQRFAQYLAKEPGDSSRERARRVLARAAGLAA
jgi:hypothetical protein